MWHKNQVDRLSCFCFVKLIYLIRISFIFLITRIELKAPNFRIRGIVCKVLSTKSGTVLVINAVLHVLVIGIHSQKCVICFIVVKKPFQKEKHGKVTRVYLHRLRWYNLLHIKALQDSLLLCRL